MIQSTIHKITELETNRKFKLENDYEIYIITIPDEFLNMTPNQLWLLSHQITAFGHGFGLDNGHKISIEKCEPFLYKYERKAKVYRIDPSVQQNNLSKFVSWLCDYKKNWTDGIEYDCHPKSFDDFLNDEKKSHWTERLEIFLMIVLLQNINSKNVEYLPTQKTLDLEKKQKDDEK